MGSDDEPEMPPDWFDRQDESPDELFYEQPRFVRHIDQETIYELTDFYREFIPAGSKVLDLMSSWISHLPEEVEYAHVSGLGMNEAELKANRRLDDYVVHNLNDNPVLPYARDRYDRILIAVSVQYLTRPIEVLQSARDVLGTDGALCIAMSHRLFPTKAVKVFHALDPKDRNVLVQHYLARAGFRDMSTEERLSPGADPLWLVTARA